MKRIFVLCCLSSGLMGCAQLQQTEPWQKAALSRPAMQLNPNPVATAFDEHIYFSREGAAGGRGFAGGGCGCN